MDQNNKLGYLEGLRGLAAMGVVLSHFINAFYPSCYYGGNPTSRHIGEIELSYFRSPFSVISNGDFMVCIFFILSGYVLSRSYVKNNQIETLVSSALRRFLRLYIPVAFTLILAYILLRVSIAYGIEPAGITCSRWLSIISQEDPSFSNFIRCLLYSTMFLGDNSYDTTTWTMTIELFGSLLVFSVLSLTHNIRAKWVILLLVTIILWHYPYYTAFIIGIGLNYLYKVPSTYKKIIVLIFVIVGLILGGIHTWGNDYTLETFYKIIPASLLYNTYSNHLLGATLIITALLLSPALQFLFSRKLFIFLGDISFSAYLIHPLILTSIVCPIFLAIYKTTRNYNLAGLLSFPILILTTLLLSKIMTVVIDKPGVKFSKYIYTKFFKAKQEV